MANELTVGDHRALQRAVVRTTGVGAGLGLAHLVVAGSLGVDAAGYLPFVRPASELLMWASFFACGVAAVPPRSLRSLAGAALLAAGSAGAILVGGPLGALAALALGGMQYARDAERGGGLGRRLTSAGFGALAVALGGYVSAALGATDGVEAMPVGLLAILVGAASGLFAGLGVAGRAVRYAPALAGGDAEPERLVLDGDATREGCTKIAPPSDEGPARDELGLLLHRARVASGASRRALGDEGRAATAAAAELCEMMARFIARWQEVEAQIAAADPAALPLRAEEMERRAAAAVDDVVRNEYLRAARALRQQLADLDQIARCHDRAVARLHHHVAVLERLRLAAVHHRSADAGRSTEDLAPLVDQLGAAGLDLDGAAEALAVLPAG